MRSALRLGVLISLELIAVLVLHALGEMPWLQVPRAGLAEWATVTPAEDVIAAVVRLVALAGAYWMLASTVGYSVAAAARLPGAVRVAGWATLPAVRRVADRAIAVALVTSSAVGASAVGSASALDTPPGVVAAAPASAVPMPPMPPARPVPTTGDDTGAPVPPPTAPLPPGLQGMPPPDRGDTGARAPDRGDTGARTPDRGDTGARTPGREETGERGSDHDGPGRPAPDQDAMTGAPERRPATHVVEPGDSLWSITATHLRAAGADHDPVAVRAAWVEVVAENRDRLRSGDPDLIYPGESITLTPLPVDGSSSST